MCVQSLFALIPPCTSQVQSIPPPPLPKSTPISPQHSPQHSHIESMMQRRVSPPYEGPPSLTEMQPNVSFAQALCSASSFVRIPAYSRQMSSAANSARVRGNGNDAPRGLGCAHRKIAGFQAPGRSLRDWRQFQASGLRLHGGHRSRYLYQRCCNHFIADDGEVLILTCPVLVDRWLGFYQEAWGLRAA